MNGPDRPRRSRSWIGPTVLAAITALAATGLYLGLPEPRLWVRMPFGTAALTAGLVAAALWALAAGWRHSVGRARRTGHAQGVAEQVESHRRFLARLDHELKNPITAIRAAVASARSAPAPDEQLAIADTQSARLAALVGDLRKLADLGARPIEREDVDVEEVARDAVADLAAELAARGDHRPVALHVPRAPWPLPHVRGDADLLYLAVHNLLSNAAKYSPAGSPIEVRGSDEHGWVVVEVADVGMGIPADELPLVVDELTRGRESRGIAGSGLGLSLVRAVAERHDGTLELRSRHGEGTSARLWLPAL